MGLSLTSASTAWLIITAYTGRMIPVIAVVTLISSIMTHAWRCGPAVLKQRVHARAAPTGVAARLTVLEEGQWWTSGMYFEPGVG